MTGSKFNVDFEKSSFHAKKYFCVLIFNFSEGGRKICVAIFLVDQKWHIGPRGSLVIALVCLSVYPSVRSCLDISETAH